MKFKYIFLTTLVLLSLTACKEKNIIAFEKEIDTVVEKNEPEPFEFKKDYKTIYKKNKEINADYRGNIEFASGLIDIEFVKSHDNNDYLRTDWKTMEYDPKGSVFMDYESNFDSQNIIIYGHRVGEDFTEGGDEMFFTPLKKLIDKDNYEENKIIYLVLRNELRIYEIAKVFYCDLYLENGNYYPNDDLLYYYPEYDEEYFNRYLSNINEIEFYDTNVELNYEDKLLTLQTCVEKRSDLRLIVIAKQIDTIIY